MGKLSGKTVLITGGNSGIGLATAKLFKQEGANVIITARSAETYQQTVKEYGTQFDVIQADVSKVGEIKNLVAQIAGKHRKLDVIFANAGIAESRQTSESDETHFDRIFDTNVKGLYFTISEALAILNPGASIVLNASVVASKGFPGLSVYSSSKAAVRSLARTWAAELADRKIRVNVLSPGPVHTPIHGKLGVAKEAMSDYEKQLTQNIPLKRFGNAEEMATAALFLASDDSSYVTGTELLADGGAGSV